MMFHTSPERHQASQTASFFCATLLSALGMSDMLMKIHSLSLGRLAFLYESFGESAGP
jgi:hypothetical protein